MKILRHIFIALFSVFIIHYSLFISPQAAKADWVPPFAPFSVEGNPDEEYYFANLFQLLKYIKPANFEVYENRDLDRSYLHLEVCGGNAPSKGPGPFDFRDYECDESDDCDGGEVGWCQTNSLTQVSSGHSGNNACVLTTTTNPITGEEVIKGHCKYAKRPKINGDTQGTDFANPTNLAYPKLQSESEKYVHVGSTDNSITWGSHYLMLDADQQYINQLLVLYRAYQTKQTHSATGHWPLGWVDWGYQTANGKDLLSIYNGLPSNLQQVGEGLAAWQDAFLLNIFDDNANLPKYPDIAPAIKLIKKELSSRSPASWAKDFSQSPVYPPSYRQGYARGSICVFDICCPTSRCKIDAEGNSRALYYDTSISQAYNAAITEFFLNHSLEEGKRVFRKLALDNQLVRFMSSAAPEATPKKIKEVLDPEIDEGKTCLRYVGWGDWNGFGLFIDYLQSGARIGPKEANCFNTTIRGDLDKEKALATNTSALKAVIAYLWEVVDDTVPVTYHLVTIPDAMGQVIQELQQPVYDSRDTLAELEAVSEYNLNLSNIVTDGADNLFAGKTSDASDAKRRLAYYACDDDMFSAQTATSIEAYALGTRIGCFDTTTVPDAKCDGKLFTQLIAGSGYEKSSSKGESYFTTNIKPRLTPELMNTYAAAEKETGVPCEILAGIHFVEADNNPSGSLVSGRTIGTPEPDAGGKVFRSLLETAKYAGDHLKGKVGGSIGDAKTAITALSRYNGGGNSNCQSGYPYPIPYGGCPRAFEGEDDPYPTSFLDSKHDSMYLLYCADYTACAPQIFERPGSFTVALNVYNSLTKGGYTNADLPKTQKPPKPGSPTAPGGPGTGGFFPKNCGPQSLSTALGCLPYTRDAFVSTLLSFIVGIAGAIALTIMLVATTQIMTAGDDAKKLQAGKELFTSAIIGLLFLIFSVSLLRLIAGDIIKLPGF